MSQCDVHYFLVLLCVFRPYPPVYSTLPLCLRTHHPCLPVYSTVPVSLCTQLPSGPCAQYSIPLRRCTRPSLSACEFDRPCLPMHYIVPDAPRILLSLSARVFDCPGPPTHSPSRSQCAVQLEFKSLAHPHADIRVTHHPHHHHRSSNLKYPIKIVLDLNAARLQLTASRQKHELSPLACRVTIGLSQPGQVN